MIYIGIIASLTRRGCVFLKQLTLFMLSKMLRAPNVGAGLWQRGYNIGFSLFGFTMYCITGLHLRYN